MLLPDAPPNLIANPKPLGFDRRGLDDSGWTFSFIGSLTAEGGGTGGGLGRSLMGGRPEVGGGTGGGLGGKFFVNKGGLTPGGGGGILVKGGLIDMGG